MLNNIFEQGMFSVDPNSTPEQLERRRQRVAQMFSDGGRSLSTGEGLIKLAGGITAGLRNRSADKLEREKRGEATDLFERILGARSAATPTASPLLGAPIEPVSTAPIPDTPQDVASDTRAALGIESPMPASLIRTESGGNFGALNNEVGAGGVRGHGGRGQFGYARLQDAAAAGIIPPGTTPEQFAQMSPAQQIAVENWHFGDIDRAIDATGAIGQTINGIQVTRDGLRSVAHLGGIGGMRKYVASGGQYNPSDSFGTSLSDYAATHSQVDGPNPIRVAPAPDPGNIQDLMAALANPWMTPDQKAVIQGMIAQRQQGGPDPTSAMREYEFARSQGYQGSFVDYTQSNRRAGATTVNVGSQTDPVHGDAPKDHVWLRDEAGSVITEPDPSGRGTRPVAVPVAGGPEDTSGEASAAAERAASSVQLIDDIMNDPALEGITGMVQGRLPPMTQSGTDLNVKIDQLKGQAFLSAFESLKGGGQITEREGAAATAAMARLERAQSTDAYLAALSELRYIMNRAQQRALGQEVGEYNFTSSSGNPSAGDGGWTTLPNGDRIREVN